LDSLSRAVNIGSQQIPETQLLCCLDHLRFSLGTGGIVNSES